MDKLFIPAFKQELEINYNKIKFPKKFVLAYSIQYKKSADNLKRKLGKNIIKSMQILGCSNLKEDYPILLLSDGNFHAINLALQGNEVYVLECNKIRKLDKNIVSKYKQRKKTALVKFLHANKIGIIASIKPGQEQLKLARELKKKIKKKSYLFLTNTINTPEFENFPINIYVNTACPTLIYDTNKIINYQDIIKRK